MIQLLKITLFAMAICLVYSLVGMWVPQKKVYPPESKEITDDMTTDDLVEIGEFLYSGKGTCLSCHAMSRFPDLSNIGAIAGTRVEGMSDVEYLAQSLYDPEAYIVDGFKGGMPAVNRPPISLNDKEVLAIIAYLQTLGGEATVELTTEHKWLTGDSPQGGGMAAAPAEASGPKEPRTVEELFTQYTCAACHSLDKGVKLAGPSLYDVGTRLTEAQILESLVKPEATVAEGFPPVMGPTLTGLGFYNDVSMVELQALTDYLVSLKGK